MASPLGRARDHRCLLCGRQATNWHERLPRGRGGLVDRFNSVPLCGSGTTGCHGAVTGNPDWAAQRAMTIPGEMRRGRYVGSDATYRLAYNGEEWRAGDWRPAVDSAPAGGPR